MLNSKKKILILMSGSIACYKVCTLISLLVKNNYHVKVAASTSALKFVGEATLEGLTSEKVHSDLWEKGHAMDHINLERWADLILVAPASSHFINRCAHGVGDDLLTTLFLAHEFKKPFLIAPAMNTAMYLNPVTQNSIKTLKSYGIEILETASGVLACGETGYGRLLEPDQIFQEVQKFSGIKNTAPIQRSPAELQPKILITAGGTREPIDDVRFITNSSTGQTGYDLATYFSELGFDVTLDLAESSKLKPKSSFKTERFDDYSSLETLLKKQLSEQSFDWIFHAAAVSDFSVEKAQGKISSGKDLNLSLKPNPKLINKLKTWSKNSNTRLVGFKLTSHSDPEAIAQKVSHLQEESKADYVVQNDSSTLKNRQTHPFNIHSLHQTKTTEGVLGLVQYFSEKIGDLK